MMEKMSTTKIFDHLEEQLAKSCSDVCTTAWRGQHGCPPLVLSDSNLARATNGVLTISNSPLLDKTNKDINEHTPDFEQLALRSDQDALLIEWWTKTVCFHVGVEIIVASIGGQYLKELE